MRSLDLRKGSVGNINAGPGVAMKITKATGNTRQHNESGKVQGVYVRLKHGIWLQSAKESSYELKCDGGGRRGRNCEVMVQTRILDPTVVLWSPSLEGEMER